MIAKGQHAVDLRASEREDVKIGLDVDALKEAVLKPISLTDSEPEAVVLEGGYV